MILKSITVTGYRSIKSRAKLFIEPNVTVIIGANDQGKTNLLNALCHLNSDKPFTTDDINWDLDPASEANPHLECEFLLSTSERQALLEIENFERGYEDDADTSEEDQVVDVDPDIERTHPRLLLNDVPEVVTLSRTGLDGTVSWKDVDGFEGSSETHVLEKLIPRIVFINPWEKIPDSSTASQIKAESHEFMRGIFYFAGIDPDEASIFIQDDRTERALEEASIRLNEELRKSWTQGRELDFKLQHNSKAETIELKIKDPNVTERYVRPSRRSSGFTHYFAMKMILHARQQEHATRQAIYIFDEPGMYLHPSGQQDLIRVLEKLGHENQILYTTHSLFMLNKTFPTRHRLVKKEAGSTQFDGKPYTGRWGSLASALGLHLTGNILFANHILLAEGDSDPIYLQSLLQKLTSLGHLDRDLNAFSVISTGESRDTAALLRIFCEGDVHPKVALLFDGDDGGKLRQKNLNAIQKKYKFPEKILEKDCEIEDYLIDIPNLYVPAVSSYAAKILELQGTPSKDPAIIAAGFLKSYKDTFGDSASPSGVSKWADAAFSEIAGIGSPSKIGIAREYVQLLDQRAPESISKNHIQTRLSKLVSWLVSAVELPQIDLIEDSPMSSSS